MTSRWLLGLLVASTAVQAQTDRISGALDPGRSILLKGTIHPKAQPQFDQGQAASIKFGYIQIMLKPTGAQVAALNQLLAEQRDPTSANYRKWLTPEQYGDRFGVSQNDLDKIATWLKSAGFVIEYTARARDWIAFSGTAAQVQAAFHSPTHRYVVNGEAHFGISTEPSIPAALEPMVAALIGLDDFYPRAPVKPANTAGPGNYSLAPGDLATIYDVSRLYQQGIDGTGQKIAIVGQTAVDLTDVQKFRSTYGLGNANIQTMQIGTDPGTNANSLVEADLDLEWAGAIARNASLIYVYSTSADAAAFYSIDQNLAPVVSESFGNCEPNVPATFAASY
jgi:subtilase family serine protease